MESNNTKESQRRVYYNKEGGEYITNNTKGSVKWVVFLS